MDEIVREIVNDKVREIYVENARLKRELRIANQRIETMSKTIHLSPMVKEFHGYKICSNGTIISKTGKPMSLRKNVRRNNSGYCMCVNLRVNGKTKSFSVHRLVAMAFLGDVEGMQVNHLDKNTENNDVSNLEICTQEENQRHRYEFDRQQKESSGTIAPEDMIF